MFFYDSIKSNAFQFELKSKCQKNEKIQSKFHRWQTQHREVLNKSKKSRPFVHLFELCSNGCANVIYFVFGIGTTALLMGEL